MATMHDVAKLANVSIATVSYVFNKPHRVKPATLDRVLDAVRELDYQPNMFAQGLKGGKSKLVAILLADIRLPIAATIAKGVEDVLFENDYLPIVSSTRGDSAETIRRLKHLRQRGVGGFIILPSYFGIDEDLALTIRALSVAQVPIAYVGEIDEAGLADSIHYDGQASAQEAVDYLFGLGHQRIGYIGTGSRTAVIDRRLSGYHQSFTSRSLAPAPELIEQINITPEAAYQAMARLFSQPAPPTAILAINDVVALGVLDFCKDHDLSIPDDLSVITYDYGTLTRSATSSITSMAVSGTEAGHALANLLLQRQHQPHKPPESIVIKPHLETRNSTKPYYG